MGIETERTRIRPWTLDDVEAAYAIYGDAEVMRYLGRDGPGATVGSLEEMQERLSRAIAKFPPESGFLYSAVESKAEGAVVGTALLKPLELSDGTSSVDEVEIGWHLNRIHWGKGLGTEMARALVRHGFDDLGLPELHAIAYLQNSASIRIMQKIGMTYLGTTHRYYGVTAEHYLIKRER